MPFPNKTEDKSAKNLPLQHVNSTRPLSVSRVGGNFLAELTDYFADDEDGFVLTQFGFASGENGTGGAHLDTATGPRAVLGSQRPRTQWCA